MPETAQKTGTPRRGGTRANRTAAAKPAASKTTATEKVTTLGAIELEPHPAGDTKQYSRWVPPEGTGCVGTFYAPLGATAVTVTVSGPAE